MPVIATMYELIDAELKKACQIFDNELFSNLSAVNELCGYVRRYQGKMLRPALLLLSGKACGEITDEHLTLAAVVEMVHMATLVHDDVLDDAELRRRCSTINCLQGNEAAVLLGDYLISHAFHLCNTLDTPFASRVIGATTNTVCEGELQQVVHRFDNNLSVEQYLQIITRKTASMIGTCCLLGAHYSGANENTKKVLEQYGINIGVAFQITDDVLDIIGSEDQMGKTLGRDLEKNKLTLPLIHCLGEVKMGAKNHLRELLNNKPFDRNGIRKILESTDSINHSLNVANRYVESAIASLAGLPETEARDTLCRMARLIVDRDR